MSGKVLIITGTMGEPGSPWWNLNELTKATKQGYMQSRGDATMLVSYEGMERWINLASEDDGSRKWEHLGFSRTRAVQRWIEIERSLDFLLHDFVIWMDADSAIVRQDFDIAAYFESFGPDKWFYAADDGNGLQSGIHAFRVCAASLEALGRVWSADPKYDTGCWWEQGALAEHCQLGRAYLEKKLFNAYPWEDYEKGYSWAVHAPARSDEERYESLKQCIEENR